MGGFVGPPVSDRQLCTITRAVFEQGIDDAEWRDRIKWRIAALKRAQPPPHAISGAMDRVERVVSRTPPPLQAQPPPPDVPRPLSPDEARAALSHLAQRFGPLPALKPRAMPAGESELLTTRERYALAADIERLRTIHRLRKANRDDLQRASSTQRDVQHPGEAGAEGVDEGVRAEAVGRGSGGGRTQPEGGRHE